MTMWIIFGLAVGALGGVCWFLLRKVKELGGRVKAAENAISAVKLCAADYPRIKNEVADMRELLDSLPLDEMQSAAEAERAYMDGLDSIAGYSVAVAMKRGDGA